MNRNLSWMWEQEFTDEFRPTEFRVTSNSRVIYGVDSMDETKIPLIMVHGSPGTWIA